MQVNMFDAKSRLSQLVQAVLDGEEVILARNGEPVARITRYRPAVALRKPGALRSVIRMARDWDSAETNHQLAAQLSTGPLEPGAATSEARQPRARYRAARRVRSRPR